MKRTALTRCAWRCLLTLGLLACFTAPALAAPLFAIPGLAPAGPHPVLPLPPVVHLVAGPGLLAPGATLGPATYGDGLPSPDNHHLEVEIHNPIGNPAQTFNITFSYPVAPLVTAPFTSGLTLPPGFSAYFDHHIFDGLFPFDVTVFTPWSLSVAAAPGALLAPISIHASVIEYPYPFSIIPGPGGPPLFLPGPGLIGPPVPGAPAVTVAIIPEPTSIALLG